MMEAIEMAETQRTGLLRLFYTPVRDDVRRDSAADVAVLQQETNAHHLGRLVWQAVNDGRSYVVEDLGEQDDDSVEGFIRRGKVHTVRVTLRDPDAAEVGEYVYEGAFLPAKYDPLRYHSNPETGVWIFTFYRGTGWKRIE